MYKLFAAAAFAVMTATSASAAVIDKQYEVTSAVGSGADHSIWISGGVGGGVGSDFDFSPNGLLTLFTDGTMTLTGHVQSQNNAGAGFDVDFNYDNTFLQAPSFKSENGSAATVDTFFRDVEGGTLTGTGILAGLNLTVSRLPVDGKYAAQIGPSNGVNNGANNKNLNYGMANWFKISVASSTCSICGQINNLEGRQGDVNIDLLGDGTLTTVPVPAAGFLLAGGLAAMAGLRRRKKTS